MSWTLKGFLTLDASGFHGALERAKTGVRAVRDSAADSARSMGAAFSTALPVVRSVGASLMANAAAVYATVKSVTEMSENIRNMAAEIGVSTAALQEFSYAFKVSGASADDFAMAMRRLAMSRSQALEGSAHDVALFEALGVSMSELKSLSPEDLFLRVGKAIASIGDESSRNAVMMDVFGRSATNLVHALQDIDNLRAKARRDGLVLSDAELALMAKANAEIDTLWEKVKYFKAGVVLDWADIFAGRRPKTELERRSEVELEETRRRLAERRRQWEEKQRGGGETEIEKIKRLEAERKAAAENARKVEQLQAEVAEKRRQAYLDMLSATERMNYLAKEMAELQAKTGRTEVEQLEITKRIYELNSQLAAARKQVQAEEERAARERGRIHAFKTGAAWQQIGGFATMTQLLAALRGAQSYRVAIEQIRRNTAQIAENTRLW